MNRNKHIAAMVLLLIVVSLLMSVSASVASGSRMNAMDDDPSDWAKKAIQYVVEKYGIPEEDLDISYEQRMRFSALEKTVQMVGVAAYPKKDVQFFDVVIDEDTGEISEDIRPLHQAEEQARLEKYGKLDPYLHELLAKAEDRDRFLVSIWAAEFDKKRSKQDLYEIVAGQWPEAADAMSWGLRPMQCLGD